MKLPAWLKTSGSAERALPRYDFWLCLSVFGLLSLGLILVYSSSATHAATTYNDAQHFMKLQALRAAMGLGLLLLFLRVPGAWLRQHALWILGAALLLCVAVLVPGLGVVRGGARRWLEIAGFGFQPSEFAKLAVVIVLAAVLTKREEQREGERVSMLVPVMLAQVPATLVLLGPDLGTAIVIEFITLVLVFVAGVRVRALVVLAFAALPIGYHLVASERYRLLRVLSFIDPWAYRDTVGYQLSEALISMGSGGLTGLGLGEGKHGLFFLPEAHTDFIFAILAQELGLVGVLALLCTFGVLIWRTGRIARCATTVFDRYLAVGVLALIGIPAVFNTCVVSGLLPTKGLPLPLVSYGGSNLLVTLAAIGVLLRVDADGNPALASQAGKKNGEGKGRERTATATHAKPDATDSQKRRKGKAA